jgi:hypothetical protein
MLERTMTGTSKEAAPAALPTTTRRRVIGDILESSPRKLSSQEDARTIYIKTILIRVAEQQNRAPSNERSALAYGRRVRRNLRVGKDGHASLKGLKLV